MNNVILLIDASSSMTESEVFRPITHGLQAVRQGHAACAYTWADGGISLADTASEEDIADIACRAHGLGDFTPVVDMLEDYPQGHFVVVSDGDFHSFDTDSAKTRLAALLNAHKNLRVDLLVVHPRVHEFTTDIEKAFSALDLHAAAARPNIKRLKDSGGIACAIDDLVEDIAINAARALRHRQNSVQRAMTFPAAASDKPAVAKFRINGGS